MNSAHSTGYFRRKTNFTNQDGSDLQDADLATLVTSLQSQ